MRSFAATADHARPGDPAKLVRPLMTVVDAADPPLRMPFGSDTVRRIETKNAFVAQKVARWRDLAVSTRRHGCVTTNTEMSVGTILPAVIAGFCLESGAAVVQQARLVRGNQHVEPY
jgi:hypothetical protein